MTFEVRFEPEARQEIAHAIGYYNQHAVHVVEELKAQILDSVDVIAEDPTSWIQPYVGIHKFKLKRFPYSLYYSLISEIVVVHSFANHPRTRLLALQDSAPRSMTIIPGILKKIIDVKHGEVAALRPRERELRASANDAPPVRGFLRALKARAAGHMALIAEVKKASPSKGVIRADFDPVWIAERYAAGDATCLSVLTDEQFFQGSLAYLAAIRRAVMLPLLRKDFIIDERQIFEARAAGADAVLLIAACLEPARLAELHACATSLHLDVLVEVHSADEWTAVRSANLNPPLVGVNNRNLNDFSMDLATTAQVAPAVLADGGFLVAESGIFGPDDVATVRAAGASAILVGESLMRHADPRDGIRELLGD